jgi:tetratricopeptide (TPR) repeat protein
VGCIHFSSNPSAIQQAESIMNTRPDSALKMLQGMADSIHAYPEETQMYWHLLTIQAKDKLYITHTNDSLINHIVEFYDNHDDKEKQMLAYYYQGRVYRDINDAPRALKAFQQAEKIRTSDWDLLTKVYSQMGYLFSYQGLYDEAIQVNRKVIELYNQQGRKPSHRMLGVT